jgi:hypothetical protein
VTHTLIHPQCQGQDILMEPIPIHLNDRGYLVFVTNFQPELLRWDRMKYEICLTLRSPASQGFSIFNLLDDYQ